MDSNRQSYKKNQIAPLRLSTRGRSRYNFYINDNQKNEMYDYKSNVVDQSKYNILTFLPKSLLFQFLRLANIYFLVVAVVQMIPIVSPLNPMTAVAPLVFVLFVSMLREGVEDFERHKYDNQLNSEPVIVYKNNEWINSISGDLHMGDLVVVTQDCCFPADMILLDSSLIDGVCYIETASLDGEKTLKNKCSPKGISRKFHSENGSAQWRQNITLSGSCNCDGPNPDLYKFDGNLDLSFGKEEIKLPLDPKSLLLKGSLLRNTAWVIGFVCYTGHNTKLILNSKKSGLKFSRVENLMSNLMIAILAMQIILCTICAICNIIYYNQNLANATYLPPPSYSISINALISYFTYMLLLNTMIPISLIITLEIIKIIQGYFMSCDVEMYSHVRERYVKAGSISLNEELGHVNYIFSDKTGTLTCNKMVFKYCVIGETCYEYVRSTKPNENESEENKKLRKKLDITEIGPKYMENFIGTELTKVNPNRRDGGITEYIMDNGVVINEFWKCLASAHECTIDEKNGNFMGLSPDDIELLKAAKEQGFECVKGDTNSKRFIRMKDEVKSFEILRLNEFSSERRRMSIIVRDGNTIKLFLKGADTEVLKRLAKNSNEKFINSSKKYIDFFSQYGYRTLLIAMRILDEKTYEDWNNRYKQASLDFKHKKENLEELQNEIEHELHLIGATIVEDKLQDQVPETIRDLRLAGIKIWMLTGDKFSTALNIALSCNLISNEMRMFKIRGERNENIDFLIDEFSKYYNENDVEIHELPSYGLVIDSVALCAILNDPENLSNFLLIAHNAASVICCRVSPLQKAEVVKAMKNYNKKSVVMSIGDGGNDVSMLMEAHIGIGVYGEEGMRAVQASDFAIGEFKILSRLLMFHGRTNYIRITEMILYFFFKNFLFSINHFYFAFYNNASGQTVIDDWFISLFNLVFTSCPLAARAILDHDLRPDDGKMIKLLLPYLYLENKNSPIFSITNFFINIFRGLAEGFIIFIVLSNVLNDTIADSDGNYADLWFLSVNMFTIIIVVVSIRILVVQKYYTILNVVTMLITTFLFYSIFVIYVNTSQYFHSCGTMIVSFNSSVLWMSTAFVSGFCYFIDYGCYAWSLIFSTELTERLRILINEKGKLDKEEDLPSDIVPYLQQYEKVNNSKKTNYHFEDDKKSEKNFNDNFTNDNVQDGEISINETKKNLYKNLFNNRKDRNNLNRSKSFSDNNRFLSDNDDTFNHKLRENNKKKKVTVNKDDYKQLSEKHRKKPLIN